MAKAMGESDSDGNGDGGGRWYGGGRSFFLQPIISRWCLGLHSRTVECGGRGARQLVRLRVTEISHFQPDYVFAPPVPLASGSVPPLLHITTASFKSCRPDSRVVEPSDVHASPPVSSIPPPHQSRNACLSPPLRSLYILVHPTPLCFSSIASRRNRSP